MALGRVLTLLGRWGAPPDGVAWCALAVAALLACVAASPSALRAKILPRPSPRAFLVLSAFAAAWLSLGYVAFYLRGGPRIIDATTYFLQARAMSEGHLAWHVPDPSASFRGRFLLFESDPASASGRLAGIFPPGYPLLLAIGFAAGAPMVIGPALAALLVVATWGLAREVAASARLEPAMADAMGRVAVLASVACAALRYHTADTMAHGASAAGVTFALAAALRARRTGEAAFAIAAGLALGYVAATRPVSAIPIGAVAAAIAWGTPGDRARAGDRARRLATIAIAALPGIALLLAAQRAATGDALGSTQRAYYAVSDGPPGCFRYGFGAGVGCLFEHGDFVRARLASGYGALAAIGTTARRLRMHLLDVANLEPLALLAVAPIGSIGSIAPIARTTHAPKRRPAADHAWRACLAVVLGQILAYAPFYFDGDYPGGGARFYADVLPIEHVLVARALVALLPRVAYAAKGAALLALACAGFAVHAAYDHDALADRDGGRPMFEPDVLARAAITRGLLFVDTDHGFALAHDPDGAADPRDHLVVARLRGDDHDRLLAERLGRPPAWVYRFAAAAPSSVGDLARGAGSASRERAGSVEAWIPAPLPEWRFEAESDWPPLAQRGGWAAPIWASDTCASNGRALALHAARARGGGDRGGGGGGDGRREADGAGAEVRIALPVPHAGPWRVTPRLLEGATNAAGSLRLIVLEGDGAAAAETERARWSWPAHAGTARCAPLDAREVALDPAHAAILVFTLSPLAPEAPTSDDRATRGGPEAANGGAEDASDDAAARPALDETTLAPAR